ncbi:hypothetical protein [Gloeobacter kilaueensis]|uniref:Uncharacterized protein n=1 Tax=Gloeobacter kilaueensis (strain ATCC BAA-2537 / CCAP 1431/1 / ULC 316 / JS1) TaxID=1183438 RepID=U5QET2_GLOK1|nr:hypothetical protein [Gloeobacter kilaueensis]AGY57421.1 hypothetical protein GKIL_1175 [Gloeobacter kilaueensis JS1]
MDDSKHKVTLYLHPELHHQLKITAAIKQEPMSVIAERVLQFFLAHPEVIEASHGHAHRVYQCPECHTSLVLRSDALETLPRTKAVLPDPPVGEGTAKEREEYSLVR